METVKIDPWEANVGGNQHSTVWPEVGAICPDNTQQNNPQAQGHMYARSVFITSKLEPGCSSSGIKQGRGVRR
jgi:hypothetical protein